MIPISVQVHHSFVDGIHIGRFVNKLQGYFDRLMNATDLDNCKYDTIRIVHVTGRFLLFSVEYVTF